MPLHPFYALLQVEFRPSCMVVEYSIKWNASPDNSILHTHTHMCTHTHTHIKYQSKIELSGAVSHLVEYIYSHV